MILFRIFIFIISFLFIVAGLTTIIGPDINNVFLPVVVNDQATSILIRAFGGVVTGVGYLSMRFIYSSSKVQVGTVILYIISTTVIAKIFSFFYDGYTHYSMSTFVILILFALSLFIVQKARKNEIGDQNFLN